MQHLNLIVLFSWHILCTKADKEGFVWNYVVGGVTLKHQVALGLSAHNPSIMYNITDS